jgi:hypothetical protein
MRNIAFSMVLMMLIASCASVTKFPVSNVTPAANITAKKKMDKNNNYVISVTASNLASPDRLDTPKSAYVVWIVTKANGTKNIGQLRNKNAKKATLETLTPFEPVEIIITAEDEGNVTDPGGTEISRVKLGEGNMQ